MDFIVEPLAPHHDRKTFACGSAELDHWFHHRADREVRRNLTRVFVAVDGAGGVVGFYSLTFITLAVGNRPETLAHTLPRPDAVPAARIGSLARDRDRHGQGIGTQLLADAIHRVLGATRTLPVVAIVAETNGAPAAAFYQTFGFQPFPLTAGRSFLLTASARNALGTVAS